MSNVVSPTFCGPLVFLSFFFWEAMGCTERRKGGKKGRLPLNETQNGSTKKKMTAAEEKEEEKKLPKEKKKGRRGFVEGEKEEMRR